MRQQCLGIPVLIFINRCFINDLITSVSQASWLGDRFSDLFNYEPRCHSFVPHQCCQGYAFPLRRQHSGTGKVYTTTRYFCHNNIVITKSVCHKFNLCCNVSTVLCGSLSSALSRITFYWVCMRDASMPLLSVEVHLLANTHRFKIWIPNLKYTMIDIDFGRSCLRVDPCPLNKRRDT